MTPPVTQAARDADIDAIVRRYGLHRLDPTTVNQIRGAITHAFAKAIAEETERCARIADAFAKTWDLGGPGDTKAQIIATAIRATEVGNG